MTSFDKILSEKTIFKDASVLSPHYVPKDLHFREQQLYDIMTILSPALREQKPRNLIIYGKTGTGKCIHGDTPVLLADGMVKKAKTLFEDAQRWGKVLSEKKNEIWIDYPIKIQSWNPRTKKMARKTISKVYRQKLDEDMLRVTTTLGKEIIVTKNHPFFLLKNGQCIKLSAAELKTGDYIPVLKKFTAENTPLKHSKISVSSPLGREVNTVDGFTPEIAEFIGYQIGDGCESQYRDRIIFTNNDPVLFNRFRELATDCFSIPAGHIWSNPKKTPQVCIASSNLRRYLENYLGYAFGLKSAEKDIPNSLMAAPDNVISAFLRAIFDCEAYVSKRDPTIEFCSASKNLVNKISYMLARFGIFSIIKQKRKYATNTKEKKVREYCVLYIHGTKNLETFYREIGFFSKKKTNLLLSKIGMKANPNLDVIPEIGILLRLIRNKLEISASELGNKQMIYMYENGKRKPTPKKLASFLDRYTKMIYELKARIRRIENTKTSVFDAIRISTMLRKDLAQKLGINVGSLNCYVNNKNQTFEKRFSSACKRIIVSRLERIVYDLELRNAISELETHVHSDVIWDKIAIIEKIKNTEGFVYDFEVPETHTFVSGFGGIVSHNTCTTKRVMEEFDKAKNQHKCSIHYINCRIYNSRYRILQRILKDYVPELEKAGFGLPFLYEKLVEVASKGEQLIIVLDEIDMVKDLDDLVYTLTRSNDEVKKGGVSMIGISNRLSFKDSLDPRSRSSLYETEMIFQPYTAEQLRKILDQRITTAFVPNTVQEGAVNLAAAITSQENGDARYALKLINKAAEMVQQEKKEKITDADVEAARKKVELDITLETINTLPEMHQLVLYAIASLTSNGSKYSRLEGTENTGMLLSGEVYEEYERACKMTRKRPRSSRWYKEYLNDLEVLGLIITTPSGKGVRGQTTLIRLGPHSEQVLEILKKNLFGS